LCALSGAPEGFPGLFVGGEMGAML
jgi:hypothetical protein